MGITSLIRKEEEEIHACIHTYIDTYIYASYVNHEVIDVIKKRALFQSTLWMYITRANFQLKVRMYLIACREESLFSTIPLKSLYIALIINYFV